MKEVAKLLKAHIAEIRNNSAKDGVDWTQALKLVVDAKLMRDYPQAFLNLRRGITKMWTLEHGDDWYVVLGLESSNEADGGDGADSDEEAEKPNAKK